MTLKSFGNKTVKPDELARSVLRVAMEGERDPIRLQDGATATRDRLARGELIARSSVEISSQAADER